MMETNEHVNKIISDYLNPIFSFTLKRTKTIQEAEDIAQEIMIIGEATDEIIKSELLNSENIYYPDKDRNFLMWALVPYVLAHSESGEYSTIKFEDVATIRKDGGCYIASSSINNPFLKESDIFKNRDNSLVVYCINLNNKNMLQRVRHKEAYRK